MPIPSRRKFPETIDGQLAKRIRELRDSLGLNQSLFAKELTVGNTRVTQTQVSEWERGTERPSAEKLLVMGNIAKQDQMAMFFWIRAGVKDERFRDLIGAGDGMFVPVTEDGLAFMAPIVKRIFLGGAGELQTETDGTLPLPFNPASGRPSAFCMKVPEHEGLSHFFAPGDYVVIERAPVDLDRMVDSIIAVYFEEHPPALDWGSDTSRFIESVRAATQTSEGERLRHEAESRLNREKNPEAYAESDRQSEQIWKRVQNSMATPVLKFGWLRVQHAGGRPEGPWKEQVSRVALEIVPSVSGSSGTSIPLTEWVKGINPIEPKIAARIKRPTHIVGRLVGWFKDGSHSDSKGERSER